MCSKSLGTAYKAPIDFALEDQHADFNVALDRRWKKEIDRQLDSTLEPAAENVIDGSLTKTMFGCFAKPPALHSNSVRKGRSLPKTCPMSALLYGPPGTSKTEWAKMLANFLGWPLLSVDPSYIIAEGMDRVYAMTNKLFSMLSIAEEIVVLLDEFDEMGRDRTRSDNVLSRFFTTAMLPKLMRLIRAVGIVFLLATNYLSEFDNAFTRDGRFDMRAQIMQPNIGI
jgi:SpoVK/Ycf46/Vps4 family AAA+-type ATPase